jgi:hypothetical protein
VSERKIVSVNSVNSVAIFSSFGVRKTPCNDIVPWRGEAVCWVEITRMKRLLQAISA